MKSYVRHMKPQKQLLKNTPCYTILPQWDILHLNSEGSISDLNFTGAEMLGDKRFSLVNSNFKLFISDSSHAVFNKFFRKVFTGNKKESCEVNLGYDSKSLCSVYMEGMVIGDDQKCLLSVVDISAFK